VPPHLKAFAQAKRREFFLNCLASCVAGLVVGRAAAWCFGVPHALHLGTIVQVAAFLAACTLVLGVGFSSLF